MSYPDLGTAALRQMGNHNWVKSGLAINAASALTIRTTAALEFAIGGILYSAAALAARALTAIPGATPLQALYKIPVVRDAAGTPISATVYLTIVVNSVGTAFAIPSQYLNRDLSHLGMAGRGEGSPAECPEGYAPIGVIKIVTVAGQEFHPGVDALDAVAKAAVTYADVAIVPAAF